MSIWKRSASAGTITTPPPRPVNAPSSPARTDMKNTADVNSINPIYPFEHLNPERCGELSRLLVCITVRFKKE